MFADLIPKAYAACDTSVSGVNLGDCLLLNDKQSVGDVYKTPATLINVVVQNMFIGAGFLIFVAFMYGGFRYITGGTEGKEDFKKIVKTALTGLVVMFAAYWIVQIIQVITGVNIVL